MSVLLGDDLTYDNLGGALVEITAVTESLEWLYAPPSAIEVKDSLLQECHFSVDHFNAILGCWQASERGDQYWFDNDYDEAHRIYEDEICPLQNRVRLINLKLQAEQDLE